jgi:hypothetical protein
MKALYPADAALEGPEPQPHDWPPVKNPTRPTHPEVFPGAGRILAEKKEARAPKKT